MAENLKQSKHSVLVFFFIIIISVIASSLSNIGSTDKSGLLIAEGA